MADLIGEGLDDQGGDMVAFVDPRSKHIIECNEILAETLGYKKKSLIGRSIVELHHSSCQGAVQKVYQTFLKTKAVPDAELQLQKKGKGTIPVSLRISGSEDTQGKIRCTKFSWHNLTERHRTQEKLEEEKSQLKQRLATRLTVLRKTKKQARKETHKRKLAELKIAQSIKVLRKQRRQLRLLAGKLITVQEEERRRLARDLHDDTCQKLGLLAIQVQRLGQKPPDSSTIVKKELQNVYSKITTIANEIRSLSHQLHPAIIDYLGLAKALGAYIEDFSQQENLKIEWRHKNIPQDLSPTLTNCVYRIAQECLGNCAKHANATKVLVSLNGFSKSLRLMIRDNGMGLSKTQLANYTKGLGFISMQERLRLVKGTLSIKTKPKHGTMIRVRIPYTEMSS